VGQFLDGRDRPPQVIQPGCILLAQLVAHYVEFANEHFRHNPDERYRIKAAISPRLTCYGTLAVDDPSQKKLKEARYRIIDHHNARTGKPLSRKYVNHLTAPLKGIFKWGVSEELVPVSVHQALHLLTGLLRGRTAGVVEPKRFPPVPDTDITATLAFIRPNVATRSSIPLNTTRIVSAAFHGRRGTLTFQSRGEADKSNLSLRH